MSVDDRSQAVKPAIRADVSFCVSCVLEERSDCINFARELTLQPFINPRYSNVVQFIVPLCVLPFKPAVSMFIITDGLDRDFRLLNFKLCSECIPPCLKGA